MLKKNWLKFIIILLLFISISILVLSRLIFSDQLIGRFIDFSIPPVSFLLENVVKADFFTWTDVLNGGLRNTFASTLIPVHLILYLPVLFKSSVWLLSRYQLVLSLTVAMFSFFLLSRKLLENFSLSDKQCTAISILGALFFTLNNYFFCELIFGSTPMYFTFALMPLFLYLYLSYLTSKKFYFFFLTIILLLIISSTLQHFIMAYVLMILFAFIYKEYKAAFKVVVVHLVTSLYWILPLLVSASQIKSQELSGDFSSGLTNSSTNFISSLINKDYFGNRNLYTSSLGNQFLEWFWVINAFVLLVICFYALFRSDLLPKIYQKIILGASGVFALSLLFIKGGKDPFGAFVLFLYKNFPPMDLYRSLQHYIGFYVIAISILFIFSAYLLVRKSRIYFWLILFIVIINAAPWLTRDLGRKEIISQGESPSYVGEYKLTEGDFQLYSLNQQLLDFSLLTIPPNFSVYFMPNSGNSEKTQGGDTGLGYGNKQFYATDVNGPLKVLLDPLERKLYTQDNFFNINSKLLAFLNIKYLTLRDDIIPASSENYKLFNFDRLKKQIDQSSIFSSTKEFSDTTIYQLKDFLPIIYTPEKIIYSQGDLARLVDIASSSDFNPRSLIIFSNDPTNPVELTNELNQTGQSLPMVEYRRINPTNYHIVIHNARNAFPLVFNQAYNNGWKLYPSTIVKQSKEKLLSQIKGDHALTAEAEGRADTSKLVEYIDKNFISTLGTGQSRSRMVTTWSDGQQKNISENYNINFISESNYGTIQNENLASGQFWQNWNKHEYSANHFVANGFSNGWIIKTDDYCSGNNNCQKNSDGSYDLDLSLEFGPQRMFYIGLLISSGVLIIMLFYLILHVLIPKKAKYE